MQNSLSYFQIAKESFAQTELEKKGIHYSFGAPITGVVALSKHIVVTFGDGNIRFFCPKLTSYTTLKAHDDVILSLASHQECVVTGGDDGNFLEITGTTSVKNIASFNSKWVDCVAVSSGIKACSSGSAVYVWSKDAQEPTILKHTSTVGGLAFDKKGKLLAVAHYGGATIWKKAHGQWQSTKLNWKGSHSAITLSPDGKYVVTAMQENALHGWRLKDKANLAMNGYPSKIKSLAWSGNTPYLVTSGSDEAICWPFDGKDGPMGRPPVCVANRDEQKVTCVQSLPNKKAIFVGFQDGTVLLSEINEAKEAILLKRSSGSEITAIAVSPEGSNLLIGDAKGDVLWSKLEIK